MKCKQGANSLSWPLGWPKVKASELVEKFPISYVTRYHGGYYTDYVKGSTDFEIGPQMDVSFTATEDFELEFVSEKKSPTVVEKSPTVEPKESPTVEKSSPTVEKPPPGVPKYKYPSRR